jgi:cytosine/adenosine deaminase-related metal-dependent hydrolase
MTGAGAKPTGEARKTASFGRADLVIRNGLILPMTSMGEFFTGDVVIDDGRIVAVPTGSFDGAANLEIDAAGAAVLPGFVQAHVHVVQSLLRHQADGLELLDWLRRRTLPYEAALDGDGVEAAAELGITELLTGGTTCALDFGTTHNHDRVFRAAERLGIRIVSGKTHMDRGGDAPEALIEDTELSLAEAEGLGSRWHGAADGRLQYAVAPRFALSCSAEMLQGCAALARRRGWLLQSHASENRDEVREVRAMSGLGNIEFLRRHQLLGADVVLAHGVHLEPDEITLLAKTGTTICHCPGTNLKLASGIADIVRLRQEGVRVVLGADGPPCNNRLSMFHEMQLAATLPGLTHGPTVVGAWHALEMATRIGAEALGLSAEIGTLEVGKRADLQVVDLNHWSGLPGGDPASRLVFGCSPQAVRDVVVDGRLVVSRGRLQSASEDDLRLRIAEAWKATLHRMEEAV